MDFIVNEILYREQDDDGNVPVLVTSHGNKILIEIRGYHQGERRGCLWNTLTWDQTRLLRDKLSEWLIENPKEVI